MTRDAFARLVDKYGLTREVAGEAEAEDRFASSLKSRQEAKYLEYQILAEYDRLTAGEAS